MKCQKYVDQGRKSKADAKNAETKEKEDKVCTFDLVVVH